MKMQETLENYRGMTFNAITDEELKDICLAIKYEDHGDEFLYIRTYSGEQYEYGYWFGRRDCWEDFDPARNEGESDSVFIRRPILFKNKERGFDGIAGKMESDNLLFGDRVISVLYRGKDFDIKKLTYSIHSEDDWGFVTYVLNTKQFA